MAIDLANVGYSESYINKYLGIMSNKTITTAATQANTNNEPIFNQNQLTEPALAGTQLLADPALSGTQPLADPANPANPANPVNPANPIVPPPVSQNPVMDKRIISRQTQAQDMDSLELEILLKINEAAAVQKQIDEANEEYDTTIQKDQLKLINGDLETLKTQYGTFQEKYKKTTDEANPYKLNSNPIFGSSNVGQLSETRKQVEALEKERLNIVSELGKAMEANDLALITELHTKDSALEQRMIGLQEKYLSLSASELGTNGFIKLDSQGASTAPIIDAVFNSTPAYAAANSNGNTQQAGFAMSTMGNPMQGMMQMMMQMFQMQMMMQMMGSLFGGGEDSDNPFGGMMDMFSGMFGAAATE